MKHRSVKITVAFALALALACVLCAAWGRAGMWGADGHKIVALIAYESLTPTTKTAVDRILAGDDLPAFSVWADAVKDDPNYRWSKPWHYADMEDEQDEFSLQHDCPSNGCVVRGIIVYSGTLSRADATREEKAEALKFLTHFVGDIHQPLHVGRKADKGGNAIDVRFFGSTKNLHSVWDSGIISKHGKAWPAYEAELKTKFAAKRAGWLAVTDPAKWATESHQICLDHVYRHVNGTPIISGDTLEPEYFTDNAEIVEEQLVKGGLRLAQMLNQIFDQQAGQPGPTGPTGATGATGTAAVVKFVGSKKSEVYHLPGCHDVDKINPENLVEYLTAPPGKRLHKGCPR